MFKNMIISELSIHNFKNLRDLSLSNLENLVILTGKNSSGKSNILEAVWLFSKDFILLPVLNGINVPLDNNTSLWTNSDTRNPISFQFKLIFNQHESKQIFSQNQITLLKLTNKNVEFTIEREIVATPPNMSWKTKNVKLYDLNLLVDSNIVPKLSGMNVKTDAYENKSQDVAPVELSGETFETTELQQILDKITVDDITIMLNNLSKLVQNEFKLILASRNSPSSLPNYSSRSLGVEQSAYNEMLNEGQTLTSSTRNKWRKFTGEFEKILPYQQRIDIVSNQMVIDEQNVTIPIQLIGGGSQYMLDLMHELVFKIKPITMIEEPENHLHPELQKKFYHYLLNYVKGKPYDRQLWMSTHSPFFLNKIELKKIWFVKKNDNNEAVVNNLIEKEDLKETILSLGVKPSDLLFSDAIFLVEGTTEEFVLPIWAKKLNVDFIDLGCELISIGDEKKSKPHLDMWRNITRDTEIPVFIILDKHAEEDMNKLVKDKKIDEDCCTVSSKQSIEEHYPKQYLIDAIKEEFGIEIESNELENTKAETIKKLLIEKGLKIIDNWWKPLIGKRVAEKMKSEEIPTEYRRLIEKIKVKLTD